MTDNKDTILTASEMNEEQFRKVKSGFIRGALLRDLTITIISILIVLAMCFIPLDLSAIVMTLISIPAGVIAIFGFTGLITELCVLGLINKGDFTWTTGEISRYTIYSVNRLTYIYAVIDNCFCNIWANPIYSKGTEVYLLETGSGLLRQKVMVRVD